MPLDISSSVTLNNGVTMPMLGLGVYKAQAGTEAERALNWAFEAGYRLIDTAMMYDNENSVGKAARHTGLARENLFITTKLWNSDHGYDKAIRACNQSLRNLGMDYVDLYLIHWPVEGLRNETWRALEALYAAGKAKAIGVSNYTIRHLDSLLKTAKIVPAVNQVEFNPYLYQKDLLNYCNAAGIQLEAYSPLTRGRKLKDPQLVNLAEKYGKTPPQILIRWALQHHIVVIPKSSNRERIRENANIYDFEISAADMCTLDAFDETLHICWDPTDAP